MTISERHERAPRREHTQNVAVLPRLERTLMTAAIWSLFAIAAGWLAQSARAQVRIGGVIGVGGPVLAPISAPPVPSPPPVSPPANPIADQSFLMPQPWTSEMTYQRGWNGETPRMLADVNGDGKQDVVGFGNDGVWVGISTGTQFIPHFVLEDFGRNQGWTFENHVRTTGDVNGDKLDDIVGFGDAGVYRALSTGTGFRPATFVIANFGYNQGWRVDRHVRLLADVNGDGRKDIVAFGDDGVWLSLATADGYFTPPAFVLANFGYNQGWTPSKHIRAMADVNGDGRQDIVAFGDDGVWIALSTGDGFGPAQFVLAAFGYNAGGWRVDMHPRMLADLDHDGKQDIVGFGDDGVWIARSTVSGFAPPQFVLADFGYNQGWRVDKHPRFVADLNGDGYPDIVGYGEEAVYRALGGPGSFGPITAVLRSLVRTEYLASDWRYSPDFIVRPDLFPRMVGDVNGDGLQDLVAFEPGYIVAVPSSALPPPPPPSNPYNRQITGTTTSSMSVSWEDDPGPYPGVRQFFINYWEQGGNPQRIAVSSGTRAYTINSLAADMVYCFNVQAESIFGVSWYDPLGQCARTNSQSVNKGPFQNTIWMVEQPVNEGPIPYAGSFGPSYDGAVITRINFPTNWPAVLLLKPNHSTDECFSNPDAVVKVWGDMTAAQKVAVWGTANLSITGPQTLSFVGCSLSTSAQIPTMLPVNITWSKP